ncbi:MAG: exodeoxyribonuclease VII small subunit [Eubacteriales bacterium]|nr:exodeoxyribonuclease VII small subunit [Eubacteriales bacterium]
MKAIKKDMRYEEAIKEMEQIVETLSSGNISLDAMMELYERGLALSKHCQSLLEAYEAKLEVVETGESE